MAKRVVTFTLICNVDVDCINDDHAIETAKLAISELLEVDEMALLGWNTAHRDDPIGLVQRIGWEIEGDPDVEEVEP